MKLTNTKALLEQLKKENILDTYEVLAVKNGEEGYVSSDNVGRDTLFDIASMGKILITAPMILKAAGEGRLSLSDTLPKFFDNVPEDKKDITVQQLLTHTSGILRQYKAEEFYKIIAEGTPAVVDYVMKTPLGFTPDSDYAYSCFGYMLLGYIVERIYGMKLDKAFYKYMKEPMGYTRAAFDVPVDTPDMAVTHYRAEIWDSPIADDVVYRMRIAGNGANFWTMNDIQKYAEAVLKKDSRLYSRELYELAEKDYTPDFEEGRGLGWQMVDERYKQTGVLFPKGSFGHCGNTGTSLFINRESGLYVIILTNATRFSYMKHGYEYCDYNVTMKMREEVHNAVKKDLE